MQKLQQQIASVTKRWELFGKTPAGRIIRNRFVATTLIFIVWMLLFDQNNLNERRKINNEYNQLLQEKEYYLKKIDEDRRRLNELMTDNENLEKFAREQYLMKKDNEDIFVVVDE